MAGRVPAAENRLSAADEGQLSADEGQLTAAEGQLGAAVEDAFRSLPGRYVGAPPGSDVTYWIKLLDLGQTWEVRCTRGAARVRKGTTRRHPDVTLSTDARTWLELREGRCAGIDAFNRRRLQVQGSLEQAIALEGMFRLPGGRPPRLTIEQVPVGRHRISTLTIGDGPNVVLIHGLGATRASMLELASQLSRDYRVHAIDLPGFGASSKPRCGGYNAGWFAGILLGWMDALGLERAHAIGNSMGGRIAIELGLIAPKRVASLGLLCPAVAWLRRSLHPIVRLLRPEFGLLPHAFSRKMVAAGFWRLFGDPSAIDPALGDLAIDEFRRVYRYAGARYAFLASARNIYLERPLGPGGFYPRLSELEPPALFIWGERDPLVPAAFARHVARWLPRAEQVTLAGCGHVPQVERPGETSALLARLLDAAEGTHRHRDRTSSPSGQTY
jgi:pimeloyl-ACP methyl ester carboxylesterase